MFDDLRNSAAGQSSFTDQGDEELKAFLKEQSPRRGFNPSFNSNNFLGMNAFQRFFISALLFVVVCVLGLMLVMIVSNSLF